MKLNKKNSMIYAVVCFAVFVICLIFGKTTIFKWLSCAFLGASFICFGFYSKCRYQTNLIELDKKYSNMLNDIAVNGKQSQYNGLIDERKKVLLLNEFIKKNKKSHIIFYIFGGMLILFSIFALF